MRCHRRSGRWRTVQSNTRLSHRGCIAGARLGEGWWSMHTGVGVRGSLRAPEDKALPDPSVP